MIPSTRPYLDPGDRMTGHYDPPRRCYVLTQWGPRRGREASVCTWSTPPRSASGPRNVAVRYEDGSVAVIPFARRLRRPTQTHRGER